MLTLTVSSDQLVEEDIYEITPVSSLTEFLKPHCSLCIVKTPYEGSIVEMRRVMGRNQSGGQEKIYLESCSENDQGRLKCKLDRTLHSPFLFISWKAKGCHTFRLVENRKTVAEFPDFQSALAAYFPDGFIPEKCYRRNRTVFDLMCSVIRKRLLFKKLDSIFKQRVEKLLEMEPAVMQ
ncbi:MAG: hypothetical protein E7055_21210 [Lentisphaerae bacterium]|nr:hypothetical protein [Lentisphaerota bacterium]